MKCDFCEREAGAGDMIVYNMRYHACHDCQNRVFKLIKRMIREYVKSEQ